MSIAVDFYSAFTKKVNSTKKPTASDSYITAYCELKDNCSMLEPVLEIYGSGSSFNPKYYYYCHITSFDRYYFINDWEYDKGVWICYCKVDVLGSFKTQIGLESKYVLRSSSASNINIVDSFYPAVSWRPNNYVSSASISNFENDFADGIYILSVANKEPNIGALCYYMIRQTNLEYLIETMLPDSGTSWATSFSGMTDTLYRSIYSPFEYIKSCRYYPFNYTSLRTSLSTDLGVTCRFGNYSASGVYADKLRPDSYNWNVETANIYLPSSWISLEAKYRTNPYAHIYLVFNPYGVIELNPLDFTDTNHIRIKIYPDYISGDCMMKIYKVVGSTEYFISESNVKLSIDIELTSSYINGLGFLSGMSKGVSGFVSLATGNPGGGLAEMSGGIMDSVLSCIPTLSGSSGQSFGGVRAIEGNVMLIYNSMYFANEDNPDFGKPLYDTRTINTLSGYVQCKDDHIEIDGAMLQELEQIGEFLTEGFFYE